MTSPEKTGSRTLAGKCFCGAVHYAVADEFVYAMNCHCSNCRRTTGAAFKPFAGIARDRLHLTKGQDRLLIFGEENANDTHCKTCGSLLYSVVRDGAFVHVALGTLVDDPTIRPTKHIFVGSKAPWFTITDDLPQYEGHVVAEALRQAVAADAPAIRDLTRAAYAKWVPLIGREPKPMTADYAEAVRNHRFDLLYVEGRLAALIETIALADHLLIENVAVSPSFQGRGLGRKLMAHAEKVAASSGFSEIRLYTNKLFAENVQLYGRLGYRVDREEEVTGGVAVHMSKPVQS